MLEMHSGKLLEDIIISLLYFPTDLHSRFDKLIAIVLIKLLELSPLQILHLTVFPYVWNYIDWVIFS